MAHVKWPPDNVQIVGPDGVTPLLPAALGAGGGLKVEGVAGGVAQLISGIVTANQGAAGVTWPVAPSSKRNGGVLHRNAITLPDKIVNFVAASITLANVAGVQGFLAFNTTYFMTGVPGNRWGPTVPAAIDSLLTTNDAINTHVIACTIAQAPGAEWYELFLSVDAAPKWVARITEAQRAAGGEILTFGNYTAGAAPGVINIGVVGTGIQTTNAIFLQNNAYTPATPAAINCAGYSRAHVMVKLAPADLRSVPSVSVTPFLANQISAADWMQAQVYSPTILNALGGSLLQDLVLPDLDGSTGLVVLVDSIAGQGAACTVWVELA